MEEDHFGPMNLDDSSMHSASVLSKGLDGDSPQFERKIPVYFGGSMHNKGVSSKGLNRGSPHFRKNVPMHFGGSMHTKNVSSKGMYRNIPHCGRNMDCDGSMHSENVL